MSKNPQSSLNNLPYININHTLSSTRVYWMKNGLINSQDKAGVFYCYTTTPDAIFPMIERSGVRMSGYLDALFKNSNGVDLNIVYPTTWSVSKINKLHKLLKLTEVSQKNLMEFLLLLI